MFTQLKNQTSAAVLEVNGRKIDEREFVNTPFAHLFPADEFVILDREEWQAVGAQSHLRRGGWAIAATV